MLTTKLFLLLLLWHTTLLACTLTNAFVVPVVVHPPQRQRQRHASQSIAIAQAKTMVSSVLVLHGWFPFLRNRQNDFIPLDESGDTFGPGPALILHQIPPGIADEEIQDMIADGAPLAWKKGVAVARVQEEWLPWTVQQAVQYVVASHRSNHPQQLGAAMSSTTSATITTTITSTTRTGPVLYFSGFRNSEMMAIYGILGKEIYEESGATAACAKVVPNAMTKSLQQVLDEISGDHRDATTMESHDNNDDDVENIDRTSE
jgi:hypothetical protein